MGCNIARKAGDSEGCSWTGRLYEINGSIGVRGQYAN